MVLVCSELERGSCAEMSDMQSGAERSGTEVCMDSGIEARRGLNLAGD